MDLIKKYGKSKVTMSPQIGAILEKYNALGRSMSLNKFHSNYVAVMDSEISRRQWGWFIKKYLDAVDKKIQQQIIKAEDSLVTEAKLESRSIKNILHIADHSLQDIVNNPEKLESIPISKRMDWLFGAMKAKDSRMTVNIKRQEEIRKTNIYEDMVMGAQYGAISDGDIVEEIEELPEESVVQEIEAEPEKTEAPKEVTFNPDEL